MATALRGPALAAPDDIRWRTRDIVVAAVIGVAFGVVFWVWNLWWEGPIKVLFSFAPPQRDLAYAIWLVPAVLAVKWAELVFAFTLYRAWSYPVLAIAAVASAAAAWVHDWALYYADVDLGVQLVRGVLMGISAVVLVAGGSVALHRALKRSGVLDGFPD